MTVFVTLGISRIFLQYFTNVNISSFGVLLICSTAYRNSRETDGGRSCIYKLNIKQDRADPFASPLFNFLHKFVRATLKLSSKYVHLLSKNIFSVGDPMFPIHLFIESSSHTLSLRLV